MSDRETSLQLACSAYHDAVGLITAMTEALPQAPNASEHYDAPFFIAQYDRILQGILLHIAVADGCVSEHEFRFIAAITHYGDLLDTLNHRHNTAARVTWSDFIVIPRQLCRQLVRICDRIIAETTTSFIAMMAYLDRTVFCKDAFEILRAHTTTIMTCLSELSCTPDGSYLKRETSAGTKARLKLLERPWNKALAYL